MLVVHSDADGKGGGLLSDVVAALIDLAEQARLLDVTRFAILAESGAAHLRIELALGEDERLV